LRTKGDPSGIDVGHLSEADPEGLGADEEHSSPLISTDQTEKEMALTTYCFDAYWGSLPRVRDQRELAEISVPKFFLPPERRATSISGRPHLPWGGFELAAGDFAHTQISGLAVPHSASQKQIGKNAEDAEIAEASLWKNLDA